MSNRYKGGVISATPPTTSGGESGTASGAWTLEQQMQAQAAGLWPSQPPDPSLFIENLFSTYLYTGTGATNNIVNGIDLAGKGGLVWTKARTTTSAFTFAHALMDTLRGAGIQICSDRTDANTTQANSLTAFNSNGYTLGADTGQARVNNTSYGTQTYVSWTFREQAKFFDVVTWTGNGTTQVINHNLGSVPGFIAVKRTSLAEDWWCFHRYDFTQRFKLNATNAAVSTNNQQYLGNNTIAVSPTSTTFTIGDTSGMNSSGDTFVAYLFAHDAGGFGLTGTDNVISCGSYAGNSGTQEISLGYEPQWMLVKTATSADNWWIVDNMRGLPVGGNDALLNPNLSSAEINNVISIAEPTATGFIPGYPNSSGETYIYIAIRRGPMKAPTVGTTVFSTDFCVANAPQFESSTITTGVDSSLTFYTPGYNDGTNAYPEWFSRLTGQYGLQTPNARAQNNRGTNAGKWDFMNGFWNATGGGSPFGAWHFKRAPSFFDVVCYTGTGVSRTVTHNLTVVPGLLIVKRRDATASWHVGSNLFPNYTDELSLNSTASIAVGNVWQNAPNTTTYFTLATNTDVNASGGTYTAYLFATADGVSKVGSYTGTGAAQTINCGFAAGCRFVFIKRTDASGDWYVWDSTRGIVAGNDPYLTLNTYDAEVTNTDYVDTAATGFEISSTAPSAINANGGTFIFLAIA